MLLKRCALFLLVFILSIPTLPLNSAATESTKSNWRFPKKTVACLLALALGGAGTEWAYQSQYQHERAARSKYPEWLGSHRLLYGTATPNWAGEYTGADLLAREWDANPDKPQLRIGMLDTVLQRDTLPTQAFDPWPLIEYANSSESDIHASVQASLIFGRSQFGLGRAARLKVLLTPGYKETDSNGKTTEHFGLETLAQAPIRLVSVAINLSQEAKLLDQARALVKSGKTLVVAVPNGNRRDTPGRYLYSLSKSESCIDPCFTIPDAIFVESLDPHGAASDFCHPSCHVTILAPGDYYAQSQLDDGRQFDAVYDSAASAVTSASLSYALAVGPQLSPAESKALVTEMALKIEGIDTTKYGAGVVNAVRMEAAARALVTKNWERDSAVSFENTLKSLNFDAEACEWLEKGKALLRSSDLSQQIEGANFVRRSLLLSPTVEARTLLVEFYRNNGFSTNAEFWAKVVVKN